VFVFVRSVFRATSPMFRPTTISRAGTEAVGWILRKAYERRSAPSGAREALRRPLLPLSNTGRRNGGALSAIRNAPPRTHTRRAEEAGRDASARGVVITFLYCSVALTSLFASLMRSAVNGICIRSFSLSKYHALPGQCVTSSNQVFTYGHNTFRRVVLYCSEAGHPT